MKLFSGEGFTRFQRNIHAQYLSQYVYMTIYILNIWKKFKDKSVGTVVCFLFLFSLSLSLSLFSTKSIHAIYIDVETVHLNTAICLCALKMNAY